MGNVSSFGLSDSKSVYVDIAFRFSEKTKQGLEDVGIAVAG